MRRFDTSRKINKSHPTSRRLEELSNVPDVRLDIWVLCTVFDQCMSTIMADDDNNNVIAMDLSLMIHVLVSKLT